jgi:hypothetical protein
METTRVEKAGTGWIAYSGVMLILVGFLDIVDGLWAIDRADTKVPEANNLLYADKLGGWGWFYLILGIILVLTGIGVFFRAQVARWIGVIAAGVAVVANMLWVFVFPITSLIIILLASLVIYGLVVYGERDLTA